jgi:uncharacterized protein YgiM (DUF1202 family)
VRLFCFIRTLPNSTKEGKQNMKRFFYLLLLLLLFALVGFAIASPRMAARKHIPPVYSPTPPRTKSPPTIQATSTKAACFVAAQGLNVRSCAGVSCVVVDDLTAGSVVEVVRFSGVWAEILPVGWVNSNFLTCKKGQ